MVVTVGPDQVRRFDGVKPFRKIDVSYWHDTEGRTPEAKLLLLRLRIDGHIGACGTAPYVRARWANDTGLTPDEVATAFDELVQTRVVQVDDAAQEIWLPEFVAMDRPKGGDDDFVNLNKAHRLVSSATLRRKITARYPGIDPTVENACLGRTRAEAKMLKDSPRRYWERQPGVRPGVQPGVQPPVQPKIEARSETETLMPQDPRDYGPFSDRGATESSQSSRRAKLGARARKSFDPDDEGVA